MYENIRSYFSVQSSSLWTVFIYLWLRAYIVPEWKLFCFLCSHWHMALCRFLLLVWCCLSKVKIVYGQNGCGNTVFQNSVKVSVVHILLNILILSWKDICHIVLIGQSEWRQVFRLLSGRIDFCPPRQDVYKCNASYFLLMTLQNFFFFGNTMWCHSTNYHIYSGTKSWTKVSFPVTSCERKLWPVYCAKYWCWLFCLPLCVHLSAYVIHRPQALE